MNIFPVFKHEWRNLLRTKMAVWLLAILLVLSVFALWQISRKVKEEQQHRNGAKAYMREKFTSQGEVNPHGAAHYGHYVFKPLTTLSVLDNGVNDFTGVSLYLEGHRQNEANFSPAQGSSSLVRFGQLTLALVLQVLLPLFIVFCCHNVIAGERENKTLSISLSQGISIRNLIWGKTLSYSLLWTGFLTLNLFTLWLMTQSAESLSLSRLGGTWLLYSSYYFIVTAVAVFVSAASSTSRSALLKLLFGWLICTILLPKITANVGDNFSPLITKMELEERISNDKKNGIDGHNPSSDRTKQFKDSLVQSYNVTSLDSLPVNLDGLLMQADEEYNNIVYDKHFGTVKDLIQQQNKVTAASSWINPFAFVRNLGMSLAGTDVYHHFDFMSKAETYRRMIIKQMNDAQAYGGSKTGDWDWTVKADFWNTIPDFVYQPPSIRQSFQQHRPEVIALLVWVLALVLVIQFFSNRLSTI